MPGWFEDSSRSIGRTPLVRLNRITGGAPSTVLAKVRRGDISRFTTIQIPSR